MPRPLERGNVMHRAARFEVRGQDLEARTVELAVSTETPVERWFGLEVLEHSDAAVDLGRLRGGANLLLEHDTRSVLGVVESARIDPDHVLRAVVRFGRSALAEEVWQDVADGIRRNVSVGYSLDDWDVIPAERKGDPDTIRVTRWTPAEVSIVAIPADVRAGIGRSAAPHAEAPGEALEAPAPHEPEPEPEVRTAPVLPVRAATLGGSMDPEQLAAMLAAERKSTAEVRAFADKLGVGKEVGELLASGKSIDEVRAEAMRLINAKAEDVRTAPPSEELGMTAKEQKRYSIARAIKALVARDWSEAGFEREVSRALGKKLDKDTPGIYVPSDFRIGRAAQAQLQRGANTMTTNTVGQGKELVWTEYAGFLDFLYNQAVTLQLGATVLPGLRSNYQFVRQSATSTVYWVSENPGADVTDSKLGLELMTMSPKTCKALLTYTRQQLNQGIESIEALIETDMITMHGLAVDSAVLAGPGTGGQPLGLFKTSGVGLVACGTDGGTPTWSHLIQMKTQVHKANALGLGAAAYLATPDLEGYLECQPKMGNTTALPIWDDGKIGAYRAVSSNQTPANFTKGTGTNLHGLAFGVWSQAMVGEWGALELVVDPYTLAGQDVVRVISSQMVDVALRRASAFSLIKDALAA